MEIILDVAITIFVLMEISNVIIMYFKPDFKYGNSMIAFKTWSEMQENEENKLFTKYLVNWVANCKLIFLILLIVILFCASPTIKVYSIISMIISIGIYFISLFPIIRKLDKKGKIYPKGYSITLSIMILGFILLFTLALILYFVL